MPSDRYLRPAPWESLTWWDRFLWRLPGWLASLLRRAGIRRKPFRKRIYFVRVLPSKEP